MTSYYVSCELFTCRVDVNDSGRIVSAPSIIWRFRGQKFVKLRKWASKFPPVRIEPLAS